MANKRIQSRVGPIGNLPVKVLQMILSELPTVPSLQAATLSSPLFYRVFQSVEAIITTRVLRNQIDVNVLPEAIITFESASLLGKNRDRYNVTRNTVVKSVF